jgi:hypothetical protein
MDLAMTPARRRPMEAGMARRLWHVVLAVCHMLRRGFSRKRVMMDVNLLLGRGKVAGRALRGHLTAASSSSSLASFYGHPREVEFSCTTTPSYGLLFPFGGSSKGRRGGGLDAAAMARAFEMLRTAEADGNGAVVAPSPMAATATPSPMVAWILGRSPAGVRPLRVTDSPFPAVPEDDGCGSSQRVDAEADDFIRKFYEQLRMQPYAATPDAQLRRRG